MAKASWNGAVIADAAKTEMVENNHYFPLSAVNNAMLQPSTTTSICPWKGTAQYYNVVVDGKVNADAAWYYADPKPAAANIAGHVAFWKGVRVEG